MEAFRKAPWFSSYTGRPPLMTVVFGGHAGCLFLGEQVTGADFWLNPPQCYEWGGRNFPERFCCGGSSLDKTVPPSLSKTGIVAASALQEKTRTLRSPSEEHMWQSSLNQTIRTIEGFSGFSHVMEEWDQVIPTNWCIRCINMNKWGGYASWILPKLKMYFVKHPHSFQKDSCRNDLIPFWDSPQFILFHSETITCQWLSHYKSVAKLRYQQLFHYISMARSRSFHTQKPQTFLTHPSQVGFRWWIVEVC